MERTHRYLGGCSRVVLAFLLCVGLFSTPRDAGAGPALLDGKAFVVQTGEKGKSGGDKDTLIFKDGYFHSTGCDRYGFGNGTYTSAVDGESIRFEAVTTSPTKGTMTWKGTVVGDKIEVGYVWMDAPHWYKPSPKPVEKWAKGELMR